MSEIARVTKMIRDHRQKTGKPLKELVLRPETYDRFMAECMVLTAMTDDPESAIRENTIFEGVRITRLNDL